MDTNQQVQSPKQGSSSLAIIIVILIIAIGGAYFWYTKTMNDARLSAEKSAVQTKEVSNDNLRQELQASGNVDISTDLDSIDASFK